MEFLIPKDLSEAVSMKDKNPSYSILAGGTDLVVQINSRFFSGEGVISISNLDDLQRIEESGNQIKIGALVTHSELINSELISKYIPALGVAASTIGARQIQNRGTIGGNVMNASPAGDLLPVLMSHDAVVNVLGPKGEREIAFEKFYKGYRETAVKSNEMVVAVTISQLREGEKGRFIKIGTRKAQAISKVMGSSRLLIKDGKVKDIRIAFGSVAPIPLRLTKTEKSLHGKTLDDSVVQKASQIAIDETGPIDDIRSTAEYRSHLVGILVKRLLK